MTIFSDSEGVSTFAVDVAEIGGFVDVLEAVDGTIVVAMFFVCESMPGFGASVCEPIWKLTSLIHARASLSFSETSAT